MEAQPKDEPFLMCCHFKATHEPYDFPERMRHLYDGVTFPEPENFYDWGPQTNGRTFEVQTIQSSSMSPIRAISSVNTVSSTRECSMKRLQECLLS